VKSQRQDTRLYITGASRSVRRALLTHGVRPPLAKYRETIERAMADIAQQREKGVVVPMKRLAT
jgi:SulP family sulfate permease